MRRTQLQIAGTLLSLFLAGAGCAGKMPSDAVLPSGEVSNLEMTHQAVCSTELTSSLYERPEALPNAYPELEAMGPLFTAADCGEERLRELLGHQEGELTLDRVIVLRLREEPMELKERLLSAGFLYSETEDVFYTRQAGTRVEDLLSLKPYAEYFQSDYFESNR